MRLEELTNQLTSSSPGLATHDPRAGPEERCQICTIVQAVLASTRATVRFASDELNRTYDREGLPTSVVDIPRTLEHLARNGFLEVERDPAGWTVRLGARLRGYVEGAA